MSAGIFILWGGEWRSGGEARERELSRTSGRVADRRTPRHSSSGPDDAFRPCAPANQGHERGQTLANASVLRGPGWTVQTAHRPDCPVRRADLCCRPRTDVNTELIDVSGLLLPGLDPSPGLPLLHPTFQLTCGIVLPTLPNPPSHPRRKPFFVKQISQRRPAFRLQKAKMKCRL